MENGRPVLASPISSGRYGHLTEGGSFKVIEKERNHYSSIYGKIVDASGRTVVADADVDMKVPSGCRFVPAPMPYLCGSMAPTECMPDIYQAIPLRTAVFACPTNMQLHFSTQ